MSRSIDQIDHGVFQLDAHRGRLNGDAHASFQVHGIDMGCLLVHLTQFFDQARIQQNILRQCGFACVDVRENSKIDYFHIFAALCNSSDCKVK